jgi:hypothetical protein
MPVIVVVPVPPLDTFKVPAIVNTPAVVIGPPENVMPVEPPEAFTLLTVADALAEDANRETTPALFLTYNLRSATLTAISPAARFPAKGTLVAVEL